MPSTFIRSLAALNAEADAVGALLDGGSLRLYTGPQPRTPEEFPEPHTLIAVLTFGTPAFQPAVNGIADAQPLAACPRAVRAGVPTWFRAMSGDGLWSVYDGSVGLAADSPDLILEPALVQIGARVTIGPVVYRAAAA